MVIETSRGSNNWLVALAIVYDKSSHPFVSDQMCEECMTNVDVWHRYDILGIKQNMMMRRKHIST